MGRITNETLGVKGLRKPEKMMQVVGGVDVPQGSFLGLLLFNIFIYDLKFVVQVSSLHAEALRWWHKSLCIKF